MAEVTYYYNSSGALTAGDFYFYMYDGNLATFAFTGVDGRQGDLDTSSCDGTDLGTITKVELRVYGYGDGNDRIDLAFISDMSEKYQITMPGSAGWSAYVDVTDDTQVNGWTWLKVANIYTARIYLYVEYRKVGRANTMYCAKVEIRVTYTSSEVPYYHGLKVSGVGELALCNVGNNPLRIRKSGTTYGIELVAVDAPNASRIRIKTGAGIRAIRKYT